MSPEFILQLAQLVGQLVALITDHSEELDPEFRAQVLREIDEAKELVESARAKELQRLKRLRLKSKR